MPLPGDIRTREHEKFEDVDGKTTVRTLISNNDSSALPVKSEGILRGVLFDTIGVVYPSSTTETYCYFQNGLSGDLQATISVTYTDSSKENILSVVRTDAP